MNYVIYGEEQYQVQKQIQAIVHREIAGAADMNTVTYDALQASIDQILEDAETIPFFADKKVIIVNHANFLSASNDTDMDLARLEAYLERPLDSTILILSGEFAKLDTRKKIVKKISTLCDVRVCNRLDKDSLPAYVREVLKKHHITMSNKAFSLLCERLPYDIGTIQNELAKLELYDQTIDEAVIAQLVTRSLEEDVFALVNAVVEKNMKRIFRIWQDLQMLNKEPIAMIALITAQFHLLYQVKVQLLKHVSNQAEIAKILGVHPYRVKLAIPTCQRLAIDDILDVLHQLADLDQNIKTGRIDKKIGFEMFLLGVKGNSL